MSPTHIFGQLTRTCQGFVADLAAAPIYVPSEVIKTRLQLQGRYNNPFFNSGYNYRSTLHAIKTIARTEGFSALFYGFKATLYRDLPYSALQFAFYEQEQKLAKAWVGSKHIGLPLRDGGGHGRGVDMSTGCCQDPHSDTAQSINNTCLGASYPRSTKAVDREDFDEEAHGPVFHQ